MWKSYEIQFRLKNISDETKTAPAWKTGCLWEIRMAKSFSVLDSSNIVDYPTYYRIQILDKYLIQLFDGIYQTDAPGDKIYRRRASINYCYERVGRHFYTVTKTTYSVHPYSSFLLKIINWIPPAPDLKGLLWSFYMVASKTCFEHSYPNFFLTMKYINWIAWVSKIFEKAHQ